MPAIKASLFVTCLTDLFQPHDEMAAVEVLEHFGCAVDFSRGAQTCCVGSRSFNNGYGEQTRELAKRMIEVFKEKSRLW